jgi:hypothetical protein
MGCFCATDSTLSDSKQMKRGVYEQGRKISKPLQLRRPCITVQHLRATQTDSCNSKIGGLETSTMSDQLWMSLQRAMRPSLQRVRDCFRLARHSGAILLSEDRIIRVWPPSCRVSCADIRGERREKVPARSRSSEGVRRAVHVRQRSRRRITILCVRDRCRLFH